MLVSPFERPTGVGMAFEDRLQPPDGHAPGAQRPAAADAISRYLPPWLNPGSSSDPMSPFGGFALYGAGGLFGMIANLLQQLASMLRGNTGSGQNADERFFNSATGSSTGDPHLAFNDKHWDDMTSHPDLLHSDSFSGGYRLSTDVTAPNANGVTLNRSASIETHFGRTSVSLDNTGNAAIDDDGRRITLQPGTTIDLGDGETVARNQDGSLQVTDANDAGGSVTTTLRTVGGGVDVSVSAQNVDLGGDLTSHDPRITTT